LKDNKNTKRIKWNILYVSWIN